MKASGQDNSKEFQDLVQRAGEVKKAINDTSQEIQFMAKDTKALSSINEGVQTIVAGFGLWQAAVGLTDKDNQQLTETIKNMQITMSALQSLQAIQNSLQKESNLMVGIAVVQAKAKAAAEAMATEGTIAATVAQKALNLVANANPYILLATALITVVGALYAFSKGAAKAKIEQESLNYEIENTSKQIKSIHDNSDFDAAIAEASGKSKEAIHQMRLEAAKAANDLAYLKMHQVLDNKNATKEQRDQAIKMEQDTYDNVKKILDEGTIYQIKKNKEALDKKAEDRDDSLDKEREAIRKAQDTALALVMEGIQKQRDQLNLSATREIDDLQHKLETEKNLTATAKQAIAETIKNIQSKLVQDLAKLDDQAIADRIDKETKRIQLQLDAVQKGTEQEFSLRQQQIEENRQKELQDNKMLSEEKRQDEALINSKYDKQRQDEIDNQNKTIAERQALAMENEYNSRIQQLIENEQAKAQLQLEYEMQLNAQLLQMDDETKRKKYKSDEEYEAAVIASKGRIINTEKAVQQASNQTLQNQLSATSNFAGSMADVFNIIGGQNEEFAEFQKAMAIFQVAINTATAISGAIAASTPGDPYTTALRIAAAVAAAIAGMLKATQAANSAKQPKAPKFAQGGLITGPGSGTSDSVPANLSAGESVMTAAATSFFAPILSAFNQIGGGVPISSNTTVINNNSGIEIGEEMLTRAFEKGYIRGATKFPPIVSVEELTRVQNQIKVMERLSKIGD